MANNYFLRTDVLPEEVPILFSNSQLYENPEFSEDTIKKSIKNSKKNSITLHDYNIQIRNNTETIPFKFPIKVRNNKERQISLIHPLAQIQCFIFIIHFERNILLAASKSHFSVRYPVARNDNELDWLKTKRQSLSILEDAFYPHANEKITSEKLIRQFRHYFSFSKFNSMNSLFKSHMFFRAQEQYSFIQKIDIQNFFPSIYTHSLSWALFKSKRIAKLSKNVYTFENNIDTLARAINFGETNGIITGPEFSRTMAELLLSQIDIEVESTLSKQGLRRNTDYCIFRFVDDIFIFYNNEDTKDCIIDSYKNIFTQYNLTINSAKVVRYSSTTQLFLSPVNEVSSSISAFNIKRQVLADQLGEEEKNIRGTTRDWKILFLKILQLSYNSPNESTKITNYFLSALPSFMNLSPSNNSKSGYLKLLNMFLEQLTNLLKGSPTQKTYSYTYSIIVTLIKGISNSVDNGILHEQSRNIYYHVIFNFISNLLSFNWFDISQGYDFLPITKYFINEIHMYLNTRQLISFIKNSKNRYFVWASVAYYIYDPTEKKIFSKYQTVREVLFKLIYEFIDNFPAKAEPTDIWYDSEWFYITNDFSKYPGFTNEQSAKLVSKFQNAAKHTQLKEVAIDISKSSYYNWNADFSSLVKKIFYKKIINKIGSNITY